MSKMISRRKFLLTAGSVVAGGAMAGFTSHPLGVGPFQAAPKYKESPVLAELVKQGKLPPVEQRLPSEPSVIKPMDKVGKYGGKLSSIVADPTGDHPEVDWILTGNGTIHIAGRSMDLKSIEPCVAKSWELSKDYKEVVVHMRKGLKWSDGKPLTTADVKFWYEDILLNKEVTPQVDKRWAPGGKTMTLVVDDELNFRLQFAVAYPVIIEYLVGLAPWAPKHYLSQWHIKYNDKAADLAKSEKFDTWFAAFTYHNTLGVLQRDEKLPALTAWVLERQDTQGSKYHTRNPYFWEVDTEGNQLPYCDSLDRIVVQNKEVLNAKIIAGEGTHHSWFTSLANYPLYKQNEQKGAFTAYLYTDLRASEMGFCFNYTHKDEVLRTLFNDVRWRQALSIAIDRSEINELRFAGLGVPRQPIMDPSCSFYKEGIDQSFVKLDVAAANKLLDEIGLKYDADKKFRLRPDGKPLAITMEVDAGRPDLSEICNLIKGYWTKVGVNITVKSQDQQFFMQRMVANEHDMGVWAIGGSSEIYSRANEPIRYRPPWHWTNTPLGGPLWRQWLDTEGKQGMEPPDVIKKLWTATVQWMQEPFGSDTYKKLGMEILQLNADNIWCIGTVGIVPRVGIVKNSVRNAPKAKQVVSVEFSMWTPYKAAQWWLEG